MRIDINLASHPYEDIRRFWLRWGGAVAGLSILTIILLYLAVAGWIVARKDRQQIDKLEGQIASRDQERSSAEALLNQPQNRSTRDRSQFLNDLFLRKAFSWTMVFEDLERVMPPRLHVVSIAPEMNSDNELELKLVVAGESRDRAIDLVRKMEGSRHFHDTHITEERSQVQGQTVGDNVSFSISAFYVPGAAEEPKEAARQGQ